MQVSTFFFLKCERKEVLLIKSKDEMMIDFD